MCHDEDVSAEQSAENDAYGDYIESLDPGLAMWLDAEARMALALQGLRTELVVLGNHLVNLISAA